MTEKPSKYTLVVLAAFFISMIGLWVFQYHFGEATVSLKGEQLHVLVAKTPKQLYRGLGKRESLYPYDGMLFLFPLPDRHGIVMRDMQFPIDIVWLSGGVVVDIAPNAPVEGDDVDLRSRMIYLPREDATAVLELSAGWAEKHDLQIGDSLTVVAE